MLSVVLCGFESRCLHVGSTSIWLFRSKELKQIVTADIEGGVLTAIISK